MKMMNRFTLISMFVFGLSACGESEPEEGQKVDASGKVATALEALPNEVLAVARASQPDLAVSEAEYETRDGNEYYDVGGTLPDGSELELDMAKIDGVWTVVETQRDIDIAVVPEAAADALQSKFPGWSPNRIIESDQGGGVIIYEFFGKDDAGEDTKIEVKLAAGQAELLVDEWAH
jgi:hypothetical protein